MSTYDGGCHCGAVTFQITIDLKTTSVIDCNCSICTRKGFLHLIVEPTAFEVITGHERLKEYRFGTGLAKHQFCDVCGIHPFYVPRSHPEHMDVNMRCLNDFHELEFHIESFDGQHWEDNVDSIRD